MNVERKILKNAAIWRRQPLSGFQSWIDHLDPGSLPRARVILRPHLVPETVESLCSAVDIPAGPESRRLVDDMSALADTFSGITDAPFLRLRLDAVKTNSCRRFHIDAVTTRLICTYPGTGTQYGI